MGSEMSPLMVPLASEVRIESFIFPLTAKPLGSGNTLFLGGAGVRGLEVGGKYVKYTAIGPFVKLTQVSFITQLTGQQYTNKVTENCMAFWNCNGGYKQEEAEAIDELIETPKSK